MAPQPRRAGLACLVCVRAGLHCGTHACNVARCSSVCVWLSVLGVTGAHMRQACSYCDRKCGLDITVLREGRGGQASNPLDVVSANMPETGAEWAAWRSWEAVRCCHTAGARSCTFFAACTCSAGCLVSGAALRGFMSNSASVGVGRAITSGMRCDRR